MARQPVELILQLLNNLKPSYGVGVDLSEKTINIAKEEYKHLKEKLSRNLRSNSFKTNNYMTNS